MRRIDQLRPLELGRDLLSSFSAAGLEIAVTRAPSEAQYAPEGVEFVAIPTGFGLSSPAGATIYDPAFHQLDYEWDFGDSGRTYAAPADKLPTEYLDANRATGKRTAHVYTDPGTYTVTCRAYLVTGIDGGAVRTKVAEATTDVIIADPAWTADNTIVFAIDRDFTGAPPGVQVFTVNANGDFSVFGRLKEMWANGQDHVRVLWKRGEARFSPEFFSKISGASALGSVYFDSWGTGAPFEFDIANIPENGQNGYVPMIFQNLVWRRTYDSTTQTDSGDGEEASDTCFNFSPGGYKLVTNCTIANMGNGIVISSRNNEDGAWRVPRIFLHEVTTTDLAGYTIFFDLNVSDVPDYTGHGVFVLGCRLAHNPAAIHGSFTQSGNVNKQGPIRVGACANVVARGTYFFSIQGWTVSFPDWSDGETRTSFQPCLRLAENTSAYTRQANGGSIPDIVVARNVIDGSGTISHNTVDGEPPLANTLITQNVMCGPFGASIQIQGGAVTISNNLGVRPGLTESAWSSFVSLDIQEKGGIVEADILREPVQAFSNTMVVLTDDAYTSDDGRLVSERRDGTQGTGVWTNLTQANNLVIAPNLVSDDVGQEDVGMLDTATLLTTTSWLGRNELVDGGVIQTQYAFSDPIATYRGDATPAATSLPIGRTDLLGTARAAAEIGAA